MKFGQVILLNLLRNYNMKRILIFTLSCTGHNLEYLHHLYSKAVLDSENHYIFAMPEDFNRMKSMMDWVQSDNIEFYYLKDLISGSDINIETPWKKFKVLRKTIIETKASEVFLITLMYYLPFIVFLGLRGIKVSGIVYAIYLYMWKQSSLGKKFEDVIKYLIFSRLPLFKYVYILNDATSASVLNKIWNCDKFRYLPDPFIPLPTDGIRDMRQELNIDKSKTVILHPGAISSVKGTLTLMHMIENTNSKNLKNLCFIIAGKIYDDIRDELFGLLKIQQNRAQIIIKEGFMTYYELGSLFLTCDYVFLPYQRTNASSGTIGYCAQFKKTVYVPNSGLLAKLVKKYKTGCAISEFSTFDGFMFCPCKESVYCESHQINEFAKIIFDGFVQ